MDKLIKAITTDGGIRITAAVTTETAGEAQRLHNSYPIATAALGRALTAALIMGSDLKQAKPVPTAAPEVDETAELFCGETTDSVVQERGASVTLQFKGGGELGVVMAVADSNGTVKGYVSNPDVVLPSKNGKLDVGGAVGTDGYLSVVKDLQLKEPYTGISPLQTGEIAEDLAYYYAKSEQIPSAVSLGVLVETDGSVKSAGGFIIQVMPGASEESLEMLERSVATMPSITEILKMGADCEGLLRVAMLGFDIKILSESDVRYHCDCSSERVERALISLGRAELEKLAGEQKETEITCSFCDEIYRFSGAELLNLRKI